MTDSLCIVKAVTFKLDEGKYVEWNAKLFGLLRFNMPCRPLKWAGEQRNTTSEEDLGLILPQDKEAMTKVVVNLYSTLMQCTRNGAVGICHSDGLEAMRLRMKRYEPRSPATTRAFLKAIIKQALRKKRKTSRRLECTPRS
jgi:hypothetical protein